MSAWLVSKAHIDYLVGAALIYGLIEAGEESATGEMLWNENHLSLGARYGDDPTHEPYVFERSSDEITAVQTIKGVHCLDYQSCEHDGWKSSNAKALLDKIEAAALKSLPAKMQKVELDRYGSMRPAVFQSPAYNAAKWGI